MDFTQFAVIIPQLILVAAGLGLLVAAGWVGDTDSAEGRSSPFFIIALLTLLVAEAAWFKLAAATPGDLFAEFLVVDGVGLLGGYAVILGSSIFCIFCLASPNYKGEHAALLLLLTAALLTLLTSRHLMVAYLALELTAIILYLLVAAIRDERAALEAGLKYFILGAVASALMLYGLSLIYGFGGGLEFAVLAEKNGGVAVGLAFFILGLAFKLAVAPFHMWAPDVYQGAPTATTAFLSSVPKFATFLFLLRLLGGELYGWRDLWQMPLVAAAGLSMVVGAFAALGQTNIKRLLAYSSVAHVGFALVAVAAADTRGFAAALVYMGVYLFMNLGTFAVVLCLRRQQKGIEEIGEFAGFAKTNPILAANMAILLLSMAGIPPLAGFFIKVTAFTAAIEADLVPLVILAAVMTAVAAFYYLRIINLMYFKPPPTVPLDGYIPKSLALVAVVTSAAMLLFFASPQFSYEQATAAVATLNQSIGK